MPEKEAAAGQPVGNGVPKQFRHWQKALSMITDIQISPESFFPLPSTATIIGGTLTLTGSEVCLGAFLGDFRAVRWAVVHLKNPSLSFTVNAKDVAVGDDDVGTDVDQILSMSLGRSQTKADIAGVLASVRQGRYCPPTTASLKEWLDYALNSVVSQMYDKKEGREMNSIVPLFKFPPMDIQLNTKQMQMDSEEFTPEVKYSFLSQFSNPLFVRFDAEEIYFLRELLNSYFQVNE